MKDNMQTRLQQLYGPATDDCRQDMRKTCAQLKEEPRMKRMTGVALAFALLLILAGVALAAHQLGTFDFLFPNQEAPETVVERRQTSFVQEGGDFETVELTVLDAVSDGISAFMAVEAKAKNPVDILMSEYDETAYEPAQMPVGKETGRRLLLWQDWGMGGDLFLAGRDWQQVDEQTLLVHYVIDIREKPAGENLELAFLPGIRMADEQGESVDLEQHEVRVTLQGGAMEQTVQYASPLESQEALGITFTEIERICTPLATYMRYTYRANAKDEDALEQWADRYGNLYFKLQDESGKEYGLLTGGNKYGNDGAFPYEETTVQMYEHMGGDMDTVVLVPYLSGTGEVLEGIKVVFE